MPDTTGGARREVRVIHRETVSEEHGLREIERTMRGKHVSDR